MPLLTPRFLFLFFFSDDITTDVASKAQTTYIFITCNWKHNGDGPLKETTVLFLSTIFTRTRRHTELTKADRPVGKPVLRQRTFSSVFRAVFYTVKLHSSP